jgi:hypothetical protein
VKYKEDIYCSVEVIEISLKLPVLQYCKCSYFKPMTTTTTTTRTTKTAAEAAAATTSTTTATITTNVKPSATASARKFPFKVNLHTFEKC